MSFLRRLGWLARRHQRRADLDAELRFHLEEETDDRRDAGAAPAEARRLARLDFGNPAVVSEDTRAMWGWTTCEQLAQDIRYAWRTMIRSWVFSTVAVTSLALGIGVNTVLYSFIDGILVRALPVNQPASLVRMTWHTPESEYHGTSYHDSDFRDPAAGFTGGVFSYPALELFQSHKDLFSSVFGYQSTGPISVSIHNQAEPAAGEYVSADYFRGLGVAPAAGRVIGDADDRVGAPLAAVVNFAMAESRFGSAAAAIGQPVLVNSTPFTIVGVMPREFSGTDPGVRPDVYVPMHANAVLDAGNPHGSPLALYGDASDAWVEVMARLKPGVTLGQAQAALAPPFHRLSVAVKALGRWNQVPELVLVPGARGIDGLRRTYSTPLLLLMMLAGLILLLACANIANLLLARAAARRREIAVRLSLGASRARVVRQLVTESLVVACLGGALSLAIAVLGMRAVTAALANGDSRFTLPAELNWHVLLFALGLSVLTGLLFGLAPALQSTRADLLPSTKASRSESPYGRTAGSRRALVVAQIGATLVLMVAAGLFARTIVNLESIDVGFNRDHLLTITLDASQAGVKDEKAMAFYRDLRTRLSTVPGVVRVGLSDSALVGDGHAMTTIGVPGRGPAEGTFVVNVGGGFFQSMEIPLVAGRAIDEQDDRPGAAPVAVVSQAFARAHLSDANPIGQTLRIPHDSPKVAPLAFVVVGVARDVRYADVTEEKPEVVYFPFSFNMWGRMRGMVYELRTALDPSSYLTAVQAVVHEANSQVPVARVRTQASLIDETIGRQLLLARLTGAFALLSLVIAAVGLYGTVLYDVTRRTAEIGIRMALGADRRRVIWMVLGDVLGLALVGIAIGVPAALVASRFAQAFLFGITPHDPWTIAAAAALLIAAVAMASYLPARAASRLSPTTALRQD